MSAHPLGGLAGRSCLLSRLGTLGGAQERSAACRALHGVLQDLCRRQNTFFPRVYIVSCSGRPAKRSFGGKRGSGAFPVSLFAKLVAQENFQVASSNVTREPQSFVGQTALERARHPPSPWAAARVAAPPAAPPRRG